MKKSTRTAFEKITALKNSAEAGLRKQGEVLEKELAKKLEAQGMTLDQVKALRTRLPDESFTSSVTRKFGQKSTKDLLCKGTAALAIGGQQYAQQRAEEDSAERGYEKAAEKTHQQIEDVDARLKTIGGA